MTGKNKPVFFVIFILSLELGGISFLPADTIIIRVAGSTTVLPVVAKAAKKFTLSHPGVRITVNPGGSGVGVKSLGLGMINLGMASREIDQDEIKNFPRVKFKVYVVGRDAVACVISSEIYNAGVKGLTKKQIRAIYSGEIDNWKDVGGPNKEIFVIDKERHRGTRHVFMNYVFGDKKARAKGADLISGANNEEQAKVALSDTAIGMLSLAWLNKEVKGVSIGDGKKLIKPTLANIKNGSYPVSRNLNLLTNGQAKGMVKEFIDFILSPAGQKIVEESGYVPIK